MNLTKQLSLTRQEAGIPALAAIVLRRESIVAQAIVGVRKLGDPVPATLDDHFHIGSCAKAMTAVVLATAVEQGHLRWDTTIGELLHFDEMHSAYRNVTLLQLLTHQAGLPPFEEDEEFDALPPLSDKPVAHRRDFARLVLKSNPIHAPGSEFRYSNAGFGIATVLLETAVHRSWQDLMQDWLFTPLSIDAGFGWPAAADPHQPWGHCPQNGRDAGGSLVPHDPHDDYQLEPSIAPAGDVHVRLSHYPRFLQMHLRGLAGETTLLQPDTVQRLHTPVNGRYGLGWGIQELQGTPISAHTGSADTFFTIALLAPAIDMGLIVAANAFSESIEAACIGLLKTLFAEYK